jgi:hypothetical protein
VLVLGVLGDVGEVGEVEGDDGELGVIELLLLGCVGEVDDGLLLFGVPGVAGVRDRCCPPEVLGLVVLDELGDVAELGDVGADDDGD